MQSEDEALALAVIRANANDLLPTREVARRVNLSRAAVSNWIARYEDFRRLAIITHSGQRNAFTIIWWPGVRVWLAGRGVPFGEPAVLNSNRPLHTCLTCGGMIRPGQLESRVMTCNASCYEHFSQVECDDALRRKQRNANHDEMRVRS